MGIDIIEQISLYLGRDSGTISMWAHMWHLSFCGLLSGQKFRACLHVPGFPSQAGIFLPGLVSSDEVTLCEILMMLIFELFVLLPEVWFAGWDLYL